MPRVHIAARQLYHRRGLREHDGDLLIGYWQESSLRPNEDIFVRPEAILVMSLTFSSSLYVHWVLLPRQQPVHRRRHCLHVNLREEELSFFLSS